MELINEYSAIGCFPVEVSFSCFFHMEQEYCGLASSEKKLYKSNEEGLKIVDLVRKYHKLLYCEEYLAFTFLKQNNEITVYRLDQHLKEFDIQNLSAECSFGVEDIWLDAKQKLLYVVFVQSIQKYNLNGDCLGLMMKAPVRTRYRAVCTEGDYLFVAYERMGCTYVAQYDKQGIYKDRFSIGDCFFIGNMEIKHSKAGIVLYLYGKRQSKVTVCLELLVEAAPCGQETTCRERKNDICVELSKLSGVGETTCFLSCAE